MADDDDLKIEIEETKRENGALSEQKARLEHDLQCLKNRENAIIYCAACGLDPYHPSTYHGDEKDLWVCVNVNCKATVHSSCQRTLLRGAKKCPTCGYPIVSAEITPHDVTRAYRDILNQLDSFNKRKSK